MNGNLQEMLGIAVLILVSAFSFAHCNETGARLECRKDAFKAGVDAKVCD